MKKNLLWIILALVLVGLIAAAALLYDKLGEDFAPDNFMTTESSDTSSDAPSEAPSESSSGEKEKFPAPDFTVLNYEGEEVRLSDFEGKPVVLNFWATWCGYCMQEMPDFDLACKKYPDVQFVMVNATDGVQETVEKAKSFIDSSGYSFDVYFDTTQEAAFTYSVTGLPITYFIDAEGNLIAHGSGMMSMENLERGIGMITK